MNEGKRVILERRDEQPMYPGTWMYLSPEPGKSRVLICCPRCQQVSQLAHSIEENGNVDPSVQCMQCLHWHEYVTLDRWDGGLRVWLGPATAGGGAVGG